MKSKNYRILLAFLFFVFLYRLYYFDFFVVPNTDFFAFQADALSYLNLSLPETFKRAPLFPFVLGWSSLLFPVKHPILFAAEVLNLCLYPISLFLIYSISKQFLKRGAFFVVWLFALNPLIELSNQPILEVPLLVLILLTIYLDLKGSRLAYLAAALASITRYEAAFLIPALALKDLFFGERKRSQTLSLAILSSIPIIIWMVLSIRYSTFINPYVSEISNLGFDKTFSFGRTILQIITGSDKESLVTIVLVILGLAGLVDLAKDSFKKIFLTLSFLLVYTLIHLFYPFDFPRFVFPILWIFQLFVVGGVLLLNERISLKTSSSSLLWQIFYALLILLIGGGGVYIFRESTISMLIYGGFFFFAVLSIISIGGLAEKGKSLVAVGLLFFLSFLAIENILATDRLQEWMKYHQAHWRRLGEWYQENAREGDKMVLTLPSHAQFYTNLSEDYFVSLPSFKANTFEEFISELKDRKATYVAWDSTYGFSPTDPYGLKSGLIYPLRDGKDKSNFKRVAVLNASPPWIGRPQAAIIYRCR